MTWIKFARGAFSPPESRIKNERFVAEHIYLLLRTDAG
jgi:hypothetical protein